MKIDIDTTFKVILILLAIGIITSISVAWKSLGTARHLEFYRKRQDLIEHGWRLIIFAIIMGAVGFLFYRFGEPFAYQYFPPSPTITRTPTLTTTPTITQTLQNSQTPTVTPTLLYTYTPMLPNVVQTAIQTPVDPDTGGIFSPVTFSNQLKDKKPINTTDTFKQPITQMYGGFTYDKMTTGLQWTAVWLHEGKVMCFETMKWNGGSGGSGYSDACNTQLTPDQWLPGNWEVQIFVGQTWKSSGKFIILGNAPTANASMSPTSTATTPTTSPTPKIQTIP
jgi:type VI secretion system secreted protein VgrG